MKKIRIENIEANAVMEIVRELRSQKLIQGIDFDFKYNQSEWDPVSGHNIHSKHTIFTFYHDKWATWFILKYNNIIQ